MAVVDLSSKEYDYLVEGEEDFASMLDKHEKKENTKVSEGKIVRIDEDRVIIAVPGEKNEGFIGIDEIKDSKGNLLFKENDTLPIVITGKRNEQPIISYKKAIKKEKLKEYIKNLGEDYKDKVVEGIIIKKNKGGYVVECEGLEFFMPKFAAAFKEGAKTEGKRIKACIINIKPEEDSVVISRKRLFELENTVKKDAINNL